MLRRTSIRGLCIFVDPLLEDIMAKKAKKAKKTAKKTKKKTAKKKR
jgi:hypothetical protein